MIIRARTGTLDAVVLLSVVSPPPVVVHVTSSGGPGWLSLLGTFLVGIATALLIQLYIVPRVETRKRREDRWERNVVELGELLTTNLADLANEARASQEFVCFLREEASGPEFDEEKVARGLREKTQEARQATRVFADTARGRIDYLANRVIGFSPESAQISKFQLLWMRYTFRLMWVTGWDSADRSSDAVNKSWDEERGARTALAKQVSLLADLRHPPRVSFAQRWWKRGVRLARRVVAKKPQSSGAPPPKPEGEPSQSV